MLKKIPLQNRNFWFIFLILYFALGYLGINWLSLNRGDYYLLATNLDYRIPFIPEFILGYTSVYFSILILYICLRGEPEYFQGVVAMWLMTTICYIFFLLLPVKMIMRPDLSHEHGFFITLTKLYYTIDEPYNCFPSLHVAYPTMALLLTWHSHKILRWLFAFFFVWISLSVLFVKQHYIVDVVAGIAIAFFSYRMTLHTKKWWGKIYS
ncbi:MAG: phosphatase PAP2 family protein [Pseudomonadota bacterium]